MFPIQPISDIPAKVTWARLNVRPTLREIWIENDEYAEDRYIEFDAEELKRCVFQWRQRCPSNSS